MHHHDTASRSGLTTGVLASTAWLTVDPLLGHQAASSVQERMGRQQLFGTLAETVGMAEEEKVGVEAEVLVGVGLEVGA